jgi:hypothetical protein
MATKNKARRYYQYQPAAGQERSGNETDGGQCGGRDSIWKLGIDVIYVVTGAAGGRHDGGIGNG